MEAVQPWQAPTLHGHNETEKGTESEETTEQADAPELKLAPKKSDMRGHTTGQHTRTGWPLATPMVPHPMHEHKHARHAPSTATKHKQTGTKTPKDEQLHVGRRVRFSRRIMSLTEST